jgi:hypothetical protein
MSETRFQSCFNLILFCNTGVGKTIMVQKILDEKFYDVPATEIILCIPSGNSHLLAGIEFQFVSLN